MQGENMFGYPGIIEFVIALIAIVTSIILHEIAHGLVALWNGDSTAKVSGRLTLNPLAHFDPIGFIMLVFMRFGYAKPVPINPYNFKHRKWGMFTVSIAGIVLNLILAFISVPFYIMFAMQKHYYFAYFFEIMVVINLNLALFNFLPLYPLDGSRILECILGSNNKVVRFIKKYSLYILVLLFGLGLIRDFVSKLPLYFDPLSWYIKTVANFLLDLMMKFWLLFF